MKEIILFLHIVFASLWIGGMLFMAIVLSPYVKKLPLSTKIFQEVGRRYSIVGTVIGLPILFITGVLNAVNITGMEFTVLLNSSLEYATTLKEKLMFFLLTVILAVFHDFYLGPKANLSQKIKLITRIVGVINLIIGLIIIFLAVKLRFGGV
ncbi:MAG: hypothetical protein DSY47_02320 [Hydrogenothermus sp.]|nr:MAG: hypothetical protein DSY47_02320 [Hydrogenothermus sp.]